MGALSLQCPEALFEIGPQICDGNGSFRRVYACKNDPTKVVKIVRDEAYAKYNKREYRMYRRADPQKRLLMAAVFGMTRDGMKLVMERTEPLSYRDFEMSLEDFEDFEDTHHGNIGKLPDGRVVIHDYAGP